MLEVVPRLICHHRTLPILSRLVLNLNKCYLVFALGINVIRSCLLQYDYSFKTENDRYSVYMNKTFYGHTPNFDGLLNIDHNDTHIHNIDAKRCKVDNDKCNLFVALSFRSYWYKAHEETPC